MTIKRIGILTRDCAGINAAIRAIVRTASVYGIETVGFRRGYEGLIDGDFLFLSRRSVSGIINLGGTILRTSRSKRFLTPEGQIKAVETLKKNNVDGLIIIGGNGSLSGGYVLATQYRVKVIGIPATIDNDVNGVDLALGADTALNVAVDALDKIRDTATSLERIFVVEVMGRECGYIASRVALAGGCEEVILPERDFSFSSIDREIKEAASKGKISWIIIVAEGKEKAHNVAEKITETTGLETRAVVLGHIQRGGRPTARDRILAAQYGNFALELIRKGETNKCVTFRGKNLDVISLEEAIKPKDVEVDNYYRLIKILT